MKKALPLLLLLLVSLVHGVPQTAEMSSALRSMVETEREFSKRSAAKGTRDAFLDFLADDGIVFRPGPVNGKKSWGERPARPGLLSWEPIYADMAAAGDLGYTTGPWEFRPKGPEDKPVAFGNFVTLWKKQADGSFKFVLDVGISNPQPVTNSTLQFAPANQKPAKRGAEVDTEAARNSLMDLEREFSKASVGQGMTKAYLSYLADDARLFRNDKFPFVGKQAARAALEGAQGKMSWQPIFAGVARSVDLGYTYGTYEWKSADGKKDEGGNFIRIWKRQSNGKWKVVLDLLDPIPKQAS